MKKIFCFNLLFVICCLLVSCGSDSSFTEATDVKDFSFSLNEDEKSYTVTGLSNVNGSHLVIPSKYKNYPVTGISDKAFYDEAGENKFGIIKNITIPGSIKSIGQSVFSMYINFENIYYEGTINEWCNIDFKYFTSNPMFSGEHFHMLNSNNKYYEVTDIEIPNTITEIKQYTFTGFENLDKVTIPNSVTKIGNAAFYNCFVLKSVTIPNSVTTIGEDAFFGCESITKIIIPNSVTTIGEDAFANCIKLTNITIGENVDSFGDNALRFCNSLKEISVDENNKNFISIDGNLYTKDEKTLIKYSPCSYNTTFTIPSSVTTILQNAFNNCKYLQKIIIPSSVKKIEEMAFNGFSDATIYCEASSKPSNWHEYWCWDNKVYWGYNK